MFKKLLTILSAIIILTFGTAFAGVEINDQRGLVGSWDLSQESYNITTKRLTDNSGSSNHGTSTHAVNFAADRMGKSNQAMTFNGSSDYIDCGNDESLDFGDGLTDSPFSIGAWVKLNVADQAGIIFGKYTAINSKQYSFGFMGGHLRTALYDESLDKYIGRLYNTLLSIDTWYYVLATYDGSGVAAGNKIYINNVRVDDTDNSSDAGYIAMENLGITSFVGQRMNSHFFNGSIDQVRIYNRALSPAEILDQYQTGARKLKIDPGSPGVILLN